MDNLIKQVLKRVSRDLSMDYNSVYYIYKSYWKYFRDVTSADTLSELSEDEFCSVPRNVNVAYIGKIYTDYKKVTDYRRKLNYFKENVSNKKNKTDVQPGTCD